ncbi:MAG: hypothetical protein V4509_04955 [Patescibacteria group bacterium]
MSIRIPTVPDKTTFKHLVAVPVDNVLVSDIQVKPPKNYHRITPSNIMEPVVAIAVDPATHGGKKWLVACLPSSVEDMANLLHVKNLEEGHIVKATLFRAKWDKFKGPTLIEQIELGSKLRKDGWSNDQIKRLTGRCHGFIDNINKFERLDASLIEAVRADLAFSVSDLHNLCMLLPEDQLKIWNLVKQFDNAVRRGKMVSHIIALNSPTRSNGNRLRVPALTQVPTAEVFSTLVPE